MMFNEVQTNTKYVEFLKITDANFNTVKSTIDDIWLTLKDKSFVTESEVPEIKFTKLYKSDNDLVLYETIELDFADLRHYLNDLIDRGFNQKGIVDINNYNMFEHIKIDIPTDLGMSKEYEDLINKDWQQVDELFTNLKASLIYFGLERK